jgi:hypothetical protein
VDTKAAAPTKSAMGTTFSMFDLGEETGPITCSRQGTSARWPKAVSP